MGENKRKERETPRERDQRGRERELLANQYMCKTTHSLVFDGLNPNEYP